MVNTMRPSFVRVKPAFERFSEIDLAIARSRRIPGLDSMLIYSIPNFSRHPHRTHYSIRLTFDETIAFKTLSVCPFRRAVKRAIPKL